MARLQLSKNCCYCDREFNKNVVRSVEHIIPRSLGGTNNLNNLIYACRDCNQIRKNMSFLEFRDMINSLISNNKVVKLKSYTRADLQNILNNLEKNLWNNKTSE